MPSQTKREIEKLLIAERKSMRAKAKNSLFLRKTLSIYNGMKKRAKEMGRVELVFSIDDLRSFVSSCLEITCPYCRETKLTLSVITVDHDIPAARGGSFGLENLRCVCKSCNWQKGKLRTDEFKDLLAVLANFAPIARTDIKRRLTIGGKWSFKS